MGHAEGMVKSTLPTRSLTIGLTWAVFVIFIWIPDLNAAALKDIRIGRYTAYTRIVFEFDEPIAVTDHIVQSSGRMTVVFPDAKPEFVRKIPFERSPRIEKLQFWLDHNGLSVVLFFNFLYYRYESFNMGNPFRIALDVYPLTKPSQISQQLKTEDVTQPAVGKVPEQVVQSESELQREPEKTIPQPDKIQADPGQLTIKEKAVLQQVQTLETPEEGKLQNDKAPLTENQGEIAKKAEQIIASPAPADPFAVESQSSSLQYYLVLALIILTIVILGLLVVMLLSHNKWASSKRQGAD